MQVDYPETTSALNNSSIIYHRTPSLVSNNSNNITSFNNFTYLHNQLLNSSLTRGPVIGSVAGGTGVTGTRSGGGGGGGGNCGGGVCGCGSVVVQNQHQNQLQPQQYQQLSSATTIPTSNGRGLSSYKQNSSGGIAGIGSLPKMDHHNIRHGSAGINIMFDDNTVIIPFIAPLKI